MAFFTNAIGHKIGDSCYRRFNTKDLEIETAGNKLTAKIEGTGRIDISANISGFRGVSRAAYGTISVRPYMEGTLTGEDGKEIAVKIDRLNGEITDTKGSVMGRVSSEHLDIILSYEKQLTPIPNSSPAPPTVAAGRERAKSGGNDPIARQAGGGGDYTTWGRNQKVEDATGKSGAYIDTRN